MCHVKSFQQNQTSVECYRLEEITEICRWALLRWQEQERGTKIVRKSYILFETEIYRFGFAHSLSDFWRKKGSEVVVVEKLNRSILMGSNDFFLLPIFWRKKYPVVVKTKTDLFWWVRMDFFIEYCNHIKHICGHQSFNYSCFWSSKRPDFTKCSISPPIHC